MKSKSAFFHLGILIMAIWLSTGQTFAQTDVDTELIILMDNSTSYKNVYGRTVEAYNNILSRSDFYSSFIARDSAEHKKIGFTAWQFSGTPAQNYVQVEIPWTVIGSQADANSVAAQFNSTNFQECGGNCISPIMDSLVASRDSVDYLARGNEIRDTNGNVITQASPNFSSHASFDLNDLNGTRDIAANVLNIETDGNDNFSSISSLDSTREMFIDKILTNAFAVEDTSEGIVLDEDTLNLMADRFSSITDEQLEQTGRRRGEVFLLTGDASDPAFVTTIENAICRKLAADLVGDENIGSNATCDEVVTLIGDPPLVVDPPIVVIVRDPRLPPSDKEFNNSGQVVNASMIGMGEITRNAHFRLGRLRTARIIDLPSTSSFNSLDMFEAEPELFSFGTGTEMATTITYSTSPSSLGSLYNNLEEENGTPYGIWMRPTIVSGEIDESSITAPADYFIQGYSGGFDYTYKNGAVTGIYIGYLNTDVDFSNSSSSTDIDAFYGGIYGGFDHRYGAGVFSFDAVLSFAVQNYESDNEYTSGGGSPTRATADYDGHTFGGYLEGGYAFKYKEYLFHPRIHIEAIRVTTDGYNETHSNGLVATYDEVTSTVVEAGAQLEVSRKYELFEPDDFKPSIRFGVTRELSRSGDDVRANFGAGVSGGSIRFAQDQDEQSGITAGVSLLLDLDEANMLSLDYDFANKDREQIHRVGLMYRFEF